MASDGSNGIGFIPNFGRFCFFSRLPRDRLPKQRIEFFEGEVLPNFVRSDSLHTVIAVEKHPTLQKGGLANLDSKYILPSYKMFRLSIWAEVEGVRAFGCWRIFGFGVKHRTERRPEQRLLAADYHAYEH